MLLSECNRIFCNDSLSSRCVSSNEDRIAKLEMVNSLLLEGVKFKRVLNNASLSHLRVEWNKKTNLASWILYKRMKILHRFVNIHGMSPISLLHQSLFPGSM